MPVLLLLAQVSLSAVGDIRLDGPVGELIGRHGPEHPTAAVREALKADIVFGNLECSVTTRGTKQAKTWNFRAPSENLASLKEGGFDVLNLANNHSMDYGTEGFLDTLAAVKKRGFIAVGGGKNIEQAEKLRIIERNGLRVGFLGLTSTFPPEAWARRKKPGVAYSNFKRFPELIRRAKKDCDILVVSFHGGTELALEPNQIQKAFAHMAVDAGADLILGHHPHVLQAVELYKGKTILYSLGNFLFVSPAPETRTTVIAKAALGRGGVESIEFVPLDTHWGQPILAPEEGRKAAYEALNRLGALSQHPEIFRLASP
ncbi:MAG: CapA family protein [Elusimicrobia bacterium]|nr:CapA family protein [Elusimicrobiota bacterium]